MLLRTLGLKGGEGFTIKGTNHRLGDVIYSVGNVDKTGAFGKEVALRVELRSLVSFGGFETNTYEILMRDLLNVLGNTIRQAFFTQNYENQMAILLPKGCKSLKFQQLNLQTSEPKNVFDHRTIANLYCYFFLNVPLGGV